MLLTLLETNFDNLVTLFCVSPGRPQQHDCKKEEVVTDQLLSIQEMYTSTDQKAAGPPQIKEQEEVRNKQEEGDPLPKRIHTVTPVPDEKGHSKGILRSIIVTVVSNSDLQLF